MARTQRPTLKQVAELAGVSQTTASMILNEKPGIVFSAETISRVKSIAERLGYTVSPQAGKGTALFHRRTVVIFSATITGYYYTSLIQAIERAAQAKGLETVCYQTYHDAGRELSGLRLFSRSDIAGIIFTYVPQHYKLLESITHNIPAVVIGDHNEFMRVNMVETNNYIAGMMMARHILHLGHRCVAFLNDRFEWQGYPTSSRLRGVQAVFEQEQPDAELVLYTSEAKGELQIGDYMKRQQIGYDLTAQCMAARPDVTAFMCVTDMLAYGALDYMRRHGRRVPEDYSICGFDNNFAADLLGLTTHDHHVDEIGVNAFDILHRRISALPTDEPEAIVKMELVGDLVTRASTGAPRPTI